MKQTLDLNRMGFSQLSLSESIDIDGGDVDGLMQGTGPHFGWAVTTAGAVYGFFQGLLS